MKVVARIIVLLIVLNLLSLGISFFIPGRLAKVDRYSICIEKTVVGLMEKTGSVHFFQRGKPDPYSGNAVSFTELTPYLDTLKPGTLFFSDQGEAVSAKFISGAWKHCGIFIGSTSQIKAYWGEDHELVQALEEFYASGDAYLIFDSSYERGVAIHSITEMAELNGNSTLRTLLFFEYSMSKEEWSQVLLSGMTHLGKDYDYCFVLDNEDAIYCSELLYNMLHGQRNRFIPSKKILGREFLLPSDLVQSIYDQGVASGDFIFSGSISKQEGQPTLSFMQ